MEEKKYRVICNTQEEFDELKKVYKEKMKFQFTIEIKTNYYCTWFHGRKNLDKWGGGYITYPEIKPITFKEWKQDYYKLKEIQYEIY